MFMNFPFGFTVALIYMDIVVLKYQTIKRRKRVDFGHPQESTLLKDE